ncbi:MAG: DUF1573 domain-containing protein [Luteolibacter sp.]|uniref:DUF1573 domain-containing protein n=1 Tax=Luteolibacter sp. TaxID=1962973 RepID=UPI003266BE09
MKLALGILLTLQAFALAAGLEFEELTKDQTAAVDATIVTTDFAFTNKTDKPVTIAKSDPTCSCLKVVVSGGKLKYAPGESGVIRTIFDVGNATGTVEKGVAIWLDNDPAPTPSVHLQVNIHIPVLVELTPSKTLSWDVGGKAETQTIHVTMAEGNSINVTGVKVKDTFTCELKTIEKGSKYDLLVTPTSTEVPDLGIIRIETDSKIEKQKTQQAFAVIRKPIPAKAVSQK